mgnify:CR=1 FL=1
MISNDEKRKLTSILRTGLGELMPSGKARAHSVAEVVFKIASGTFPGAKASDVLAAAAFLRDTVEGKPKETHEILRGNEVTQEQIEAKRRELEIALNVNAHQIEHVVETPPARAL